MFSLSSITATFASTQKRFKKFGKKLRKQRDGEVDCGEAACSDLPKRWKTMAKEGATWLEMQKMECIICAAERLRRNRLVEPQDPRLLKEPFLSAPYVHRNNQPKYHAMLLRAVEHAKRGQNGSKHILWVRAQDKPHNEKELLISLYIL